KPSCTSSGSAPGATTPAMPADCAWADVAISMATAAALNASIACTAERFARFARFLVVGIASSRRCHWQSLFNLEPDLRNELLPARHLGSDARAQRVGVGQDHGHADGGGLVLEDRVLARPGQLRLQARGDGGGQATRGEQRVPVGRDIA